MTADWLPPDEIRAAAEVYHELGPEYQQAVVDNFLDRISKEIDARVDARIAQVQAADAARRVRAVRPARVHSALLPIVSLALGIPLTAIGLHNHRASNGAAVLLVWIIIGVINVAYARHNRPEVPPAR